jgi:hypothetical protein
MAGLGVSLKAVRGFGKLLKIILQFTYLGLKLAFSFTYESRHRVDKED